MLTFYVVIFIIKQYFRNQKKISTKSQPGDAYSRDAYKKNVYRNRIKWGRIKFNDRACIYILCIFV